MFDIEYVEGDAQAGVAPTALTAKQLNTFVEELLAILVDAGVTPDENDNGQVLESLHDLFLSPGEGAVLIDIEDLGGYYTGDDVETVLQEIGAKLAAGEFPAGTRMLFQQGAAPAGWTKENGAAYSGAMVVGVTGTPATGGTGNPRSHSHTVNSHSHGPSTMKAGVGKSVAVGGLSLFSAETGATTNALRSPSGTVEVDFGPAGLTVTGNTGTSAPGTDSFAPKYFEVIVAQKN